MEIRDLQSRVEEWIATFGVRYFDILTNMAILTEETGEVARVIARGWGEQSFKKSEFNPEDGEPVEIFASKKLATELADLIWVAVCIANQAGIDLEQALEETFLKKTTRDKDRHLNNSKLISPLKDSSPCVE